jgi:hypothetical protein
VAIVAVFGAALIFQQEDSAPTITSLPPLIDEPVSLTTPPPAAAKMAEDASVDWSAVRRRMTFPDVGDEFSAEQVALYNSLHIEPFNPLLQKDCPTDEEVRLDWARQKDELAKHQAENPDATDPTYITPCTLVFERPVHAYTTLPIEELKKLAYSDALAALYVGFRAKMTGSIYDHATDERRFIEDQERISWMYRAAALSGKPGPLILLADIRYANPLTDNDFIQRISAELAAKYMGDPRAQPDVWKGKYKAFLSGTPELRAACPSCNLLEGNQLEKTLEENVNIANDWTKAYFGKFQ